MGPVQRRVEHALQEVGSRWCRRRLNSHPSKLHQRRDQAAAAARQRAGGVEHARSLTKPAALNLRAEKDELLTAAAISSG